MITKRIIKGLLAVLTAMCMLFSACFMTNAETPADFGDSNNDGVVDIIDLVHLKKAMIAGNAKTDLNFDKVTNERDLTVMLLVVLNIYKYPEGLNYGLEGGGNSTSW